MNSKLLMVICTSCTLLAGMSGCGLQSVNPDGPHTLLFNNKSFTTPADLRMVLRAKRKSDDRIVTCAEPSPDIARLVSQSQSDEVKLGVTLPSGISPEAAFAWSAGRAEGMAQLTDRLATIQILRDAMYRACEAYANDAIGEVAYALVLSRSERLMTELLMSELIAGRKPMPLMAFAASSDASGATDLQLAANNLNLLPLQHKLADTLNDLTQEVGRPVDVNNLGQISSLPNLSHKAKELLGTADSLRGQVMNKQDQVLRMAGLGNLADIAGLGKFPGISAPAGKPGHAGAKTAPLPSAGAVTAAADATVELERVKALAEFARVRQTSASVDALDGIEVACLTYLSGDNTKTGEQPPTTDSANNRCTLQKMCMKALTQIFATKRYEVLDALASSGGRPSALRNAKMSAGTASATQSPQQQDDCGLEGAAEPVQNRPASNKTFARTSAPAMKVSRR